MNLKALTKSWKTTVAGVVSGVVATLLYMGVIDAAQAAAILAALQAVGLISARDGDVSSQDAGIRPK